jgi:diguanylate cyclase (GGDEF)-like protein/PAS domain S-box-containing protein
MKIAPLPKNEQERLSELKKYNILDTEPDIVFDNMVQLASYICKTPIAAISLVDGTRQWFKSIVGLDVRETSRDVAFCAHTILDNEPLVVENALFDERFFDNPLVTSNPNIRFYAGVPLITQEGLHLGTLCVIDTEARQITIEQLSAIKTLAHSVMSHLELRLSHKKIRNYVDELQLSATIFETATENIIVTDHNNCFITVNPAFTRTTGYTLEEIKGLNPKILKSGKQTPKFYSKMWKELNRDGQWNGELCNKKKNGELYIEWLSIKVIFNEDKTVKMYVATFSDITEKKKADEIIWRQANYDLLTNLPNRHLFNDCLKREIKIANRTKKSLAILFIDLDYFKEVNDAYGHEIGDSLLIKVAKRINETIRETDTVARLGGDEFVVILSQMENENDINKVAKLIINKLSIPFDLNGITVTISASIGISIYPKDSLVEKELLIYADKAMYDAKKDGKGKNSFYN